MSLQPQAFQIQGGCGCHAVRYRIQVPAEADRMPHRVPGLQFPQIIICHCDDCRAASAGLAMPAFVTPAVYVTFSLVKESASVPKSGRIPDHHYDEWFSFQDLFSGEVQDSREYLRIYSSSPDVFRAFCGRCGTTLSAINFEPPRQPENKQLMAILLGSVDKADLEKYRLKPFRHVWLEDRISWIGSLGNLPKHDLFMYDEFLDEDW